MIDRFLDTEFPSGIPFLTAFFRAYEYGTMRLKLTATIMMPITIIAMNNGVLKLKVPSHIDRIYLASGVTTEAEGMKNKVIGIILLPIPL